MRTSILDTDAYKIAMAQAGAPLREETFYLSFRRKGWQYVPFDLEAEIMSFLGGFQTDGTLGTRYLENCGYGLASWKERFVPESEERSFVW